MCDGICYSYHSCRNLVWQTLSQIIEIQVLLQKSVPPVGMKAEGGYVAKCYVEKANQIKSQQNQ